MRQAIPILAIAALAGCLFSPAKSGDRFPLSTRIWDGVELDSAGKKIPLSGWVRIDFQEDESARIQIGLSQGAAPYVIRSSGRLQFGFEDEPLVMGSAETKFDTAAERWLPGFFATVDRYLEEDGKLYLRASAYPEVLASLDFGDTSVVIPVLPDTLTEPDPDTLTHRPPEDTAQPILLTLPKDFPGYAGRGVPLFRRALFDSITAAWERWKKAKIHHYSYRFLEVCNCPDPRSGYITVDSGRVISFISDAKGDVPPPSFSILPTAERLFAQFGLLLTEPVHAGEILEGWFHPVGFPLYLNADPLPEATKDEIGFLVEEFRDLGLPVVKEGALIFLRGKTWNVETINGQLALKGDGAGSPTLAVGAQGDWTATFACNRLSGYFKPISEIALIPTVIERTYVECGETEALQGVLELFSKRIYVVKGEEGGLLLMHDSGFSAQLQPLNPSELAEKL